MDLEPAVASSLIESEVSDLPSLAVVLGSGFNFVLESWEIEARFPFAELPGFFTPTVPGHEEAAILVAATGKCRLLVVSGRMHYHEGYSMDTATLPIRVLARCGIKKVLLTNAAGAIRQDFQVGDLVMLVDHINFMGINPLHKWAWTEGPGFVDLSSLYSERLNECLERQGDRHRLRIRRGVYVGVTGPSFETPAEVRMFERMGGDMVGMSVLPEAVAACRCGLEVAGLSYITNLAAGYAYDAIRHEKVLTEVNDNREKLARFLTDFFEEVGS